MGAFRGVGTTDSTKIGGIWNRVGVVLPGVLPEEEEGPDRWGRAISETRKGGGGSRATCWAGLLPVRRACGGFLLGRLGLARLGRFPLFFP
jgi:hypothetical protein